MKTEIQWIPVGERLPEPEHDYVEYLVTIQHKKINREHEAFTTTANFNAFHKIWLNPESETVIEWEETRILAWAEMPQPYEG